MTFPSKLVNRLNQRVIKQNLRILDTRVYKTDFYSNDYLGFSRNTFLLDEVNHLVRRQVLKLSSGGSRLLSGNYPLYEAAELGLKKFYNSKEVLIFNSGYNANVGLMSSVPQRGDIILYDQYIHASIREGMALSNAKSYKFKHNNLENLTKISNHPNVRNTDGEVYVVVESIYSMDGDSPDLLKLSKFCTQNKFHLIVDEAHGVGFFDRGAGLVNHLHLEKKIFARVITFGKALGSHGAAVLGGEELKAYLINFARSIIYTTALPPHSVASIIVVHKALENTTERYKLSQNIEYFKQMYNDLGLSSYFINSNSAIHSFILPNQTDLRKMTRLLQSRGFGVKAILSPTVPEDKQRLRFCIHSYNTQNDIDKVLYTLKEAMG